MSTDRPKMADYIALSLERWLRPVDGRASAQDVIDLLSKTTGMPVALVSEDAGSVRVSMSVSAEHLAAMAALRYSDGASHEDVTAWLEEATAGRFRDVLWEIECHTAESSVFKRWMLAPKMITMTLELGPEAPHG